MLDQEKLDKIWDFNNTTADRYRRSMVPFYLLVMESNKYPIYVDNSNLNPNLTTDFKIKLVTVQVTAKVNEIFTAIHRKGAFKNRSHISVMLDR